MTMSERTIQQFGARARIERRFGRAMLARLGLIPTATLPEGASTTTADRAARESTTRRLPCEDRPAPLTAPSEGKGTLYVNAGRDHCERDQEMLMKPDAAGLPPVASGTAHTKAPTRL